MTVLTTLTSDEAWSPDVPGNFNPFAVVEDALILRTSTLAGVVEGDDVMLRVPVVIDDDATVVVEGDTIPEGDPELSEVVVATAKVSQLLRVSREQLAQPNAQEMLAQSAQRAVIKKADSLYVAAAIPTPPAVAPAAGLLNVTGTADGGEVTADLDELIDAVALIEGNGGRATHVIAAPDAWARLRKIKAGTGSAATLLGAGTADAERMVLGLPVYTSPAMPTGTLLVLDGNSIVSAVGPVRVDTSDHAYFAADSVGVRVTWRIGHAVVFPNRVVKLDVPAAV